MDFQVGVAINLLGTAAGLQALRTLEAAFQRVQSAVSRTEGAVAKLRASWQGVAIGAGAVGGGLVVGLVRAAEAAARYQNTLNIIRTSTRATTDEIAALSEAIQEHALRSSLSYQQAADLARGFAQAGVPFHAIQFLMGQQDMYAAARLLQIYGKAPDMFSVGKELVAILHQLGIYGRTPAEQQLMLDMMRRTALAETVSPASLQNMIRMASYVLPYSAQVLRADPRQVYDMLIASLQAAGGAGGGGRAGALSGAAWRALFTRIFPGVFGGGLLTGVSGPILAGMGFTTVDQVRSAVYRRVGQQFVLDPMRLIGLLEQTFARAQTLAGQREMITRAWSAAVAEDNRSALKKLAPLYSTIVQRGTQIEPGRFLTMFLTYALGAQGATLAALVSTPGFRQALGQIQAQTQGTTSQQIVQQRQQSVLQEQFAQLRASLDSLAITIGKNVLPMVMAVTKALTGWIQGLNAFLRANPALTRAMVTFFAIGGGMLMAVGAIGLFVAALGAAEFLGPVMLAGLAVAGLAAAVAAAWPLMSRAAQQVGQVWHRIASDLVQAFSDAWGRLRSVWTQVTEWVRMHIQPIEQGIRRFFGLPSAPPAPPSGQRLVPAIGGGYVTVPATPTRAATPPAAAPGHLITHPAVAPRTGVGGLVVNGGIHLTVHAAGATDHQTLARQLVASFVDELQHIGIATSVGQGTRESPHLAGVPA